MNAPDLAPPLFQMEPPYPDMQDKKLRVTQAGKAEVGKLVVYHRAKEGKFGLRVDIVRPPVYHQTTQPASMDQWEHVGDVPIVSLKLSQQQIRRILRSNVKEWDFELNLD